MQWDDSQNAGFTSGAPWLHVNPNFDEINVKANLEDPKSIFYCYQKLIQLRKENPIVVWGDFELVMDVPEQVFMYMRHYEGQTWVVVANFSEEVTTVELSDFAQSDDVIISNYERSVVDFKQLDLKPYEAFAVKL